MNPKKALVIGIDDYPGRPLRCCVNDATEVARLLRTNEDKSVNFDVKLLTSAKNTVDNAAILEAVSQFFRSSNHAETAVLYFAGHGLIDPRTNAGYIAGSDARDGAWGVSLSSLLTLANSAYPTIGSSVIILDCCHAGHLGAAAPWDAGGASVIGTGLTILTSCNDEEKSKERGQHGVFTELLLDALRGGCADIRGHITPASVYAHIDQVLGAHDQRPLYKANVQQFVTLRHVLPRIRPDVLRRLPAHFPDPDSVFTLDPSYEPDRKNIPEEFRHLPINPDHVGVFDDLKKYNRQGLVVPVDATDMYYAVINSKGCKLTSLGKHYRRLAEKEQD
jgi:hypothetical protein